MGDGALLGRTGGMLATLLWAVSSMVGGVLVAGCVADGSDGGTGPGSGGVGSGGVGSGGVGSGGSGSGGVGSGGAAPTTPPPTSAFGEVHEGQFWIGPVDFAESQWHNACSPAGRKYGTKIQELYGNYLIGLDNRVFNQDCDRCAKVTANGVTVVAHVVTYGDDTGPHDIDVSPELHSAVRGDSGNKLTWQLVTCPTTEPVYYEFDGRDWTNPWYFRVYVRNSRSPVGKVEARLPGGAYAACEAQSDGAYQCGGGDFSTGFELRLTSLDGSATLEDTLPGITTFDPTTPQRSHGNL